MTLTVRSKTAMPPARGIAPALPRRGARRFAPPGRGRFELWAEAMELETLDHGSFSESNPHPCFIALAGHYPFRKVVATCLKELLAREAETMCALTVGARVH